MRLQELFEADGLDDKIKQLEADLKSDFKLKSLLLFKRSNGDLKLDSIIIDKQDRNQGIGSSIMKKICQFADSNKLRIVLTTGVRDPYHGTTSAGRLKSFYKRFGFVENAGRNRDYTISENMFRNPR